MFKYDISLILYQNLQDFIILWLFVPAYDHRTRAASDAHNLYLLQFTTALNVTQISLVSRL